MKSIVPSRMRRSISPSAALRRETPVAAVAPAPAPLERRAGGPEGLCVLRRRRGTALGRRAGMLGAGLLLAGFNTGNNLFYLVFTVMAASELVGYLLAGRALRGVRGDMTVPRRARAGAPMRITIQLRNERRYLPIPALLWHVGTSSGEQAEIRTPALAAGGSGWGTGRLVPQRRGRLAFETAEAQTDFPLGLTRRTVRLKAPPTTTLVTPALAFEGRESAGERRGDVRRLSHPRGTGEEPVEARDYRRGDDARWIDWKASARSTKLMWRDRRGEPPRALSVRLDRRCRSEAEFEERISRAAGSAARELSRGRSVGFISDEREILPRSGPAQRRRILDYLALVERRPATTEVPR